MSSVLSAFESTPKQFRGEIIQHAGRIRDTQSITTPLQIAFKKKVVQSLDTFDLEAIKGHLAKKACFAKTLSHVLLGEILETIRDQHLGSINDFDVVLITSNSIPVFCFMNSSKLKVDFNRRKISQDKERLLKLKEEAIVSEHKGLPVLVDDILEKMDGMLSGDKQDELMLHCALRMDEYSYCLDLNHQVHSNLTLLFWNNFLLCGIVALVGAGAYLYSRQKNSTQ
jgi:hypothetical protein